MHEISYPEGLMYIILYDRHLKLAQQRKKKVKLNIWKRFYVPNGTERYDLIQQMTSFPKHKFPTNQFKWFLEILSHSHVFCKTLFNILIIPFPIFVFNFSGD